MKAYCNSAWDPVLRSPGGSAGVVAVALAAACALSHAQGGTWRPGRPVEFVVAVGAGGATDHTARFMQKIIQDRRLMDTPVIITNKPGGGGNLALNYLVQHPGNGHHLLNSTLPAPWTWRLSACALPTSTA